MYILFLDNIRYFVLERNFINVMNMEEFLVRVYIYVDIREFI